MESTIENQGEMKEKSDGRLVHPRQKKGLSSVAHDVLSCLLINDLSETGFITASETVFYRLVEVNTETLAEPMPRACYKSFADCCAAVS